MNDLNKKYYKISEVAELVGVNASTLRFWEGQFPMIRPKRNDHGSRFYTPEDIERIRMIHFLVKEKGMKIEAAREQLRKNRTGILRKSEALTRLRSIRDRLQLLVDALDSKS